MITLEYFDKLTSVLTEIKEKEIDRMQAVAQKVAKTIENDGIIYIFGCGHSHLIALDCFYRAGGL